MPINELEPIERRTTVERVERVLRDGILRGHFPTGEKLPPERELANTLGVTRVTLRSALARLSASGLLATVQGDGHRVLDVRTHGGLERLPDMAAAFREDVPRVLALIRDLLALRRLVLAEAAAACSIDSKELHDELHACVAEMEAALESHDAFVRADMAFGRAILRGANNLAFELTFNTMVTVAESEPELMHALYADRQLLLDAARAMLAMLALHDPGLSRNNVREGLETLDNDRLDSIAARLDERGSHTKGPRK